MYIILIVLVVSLVNVFLTPDGNKAGQTVEVLPYSQFLNEVDLGNVTKVKIDREQLRNAQIRQGLRPTSLIQGRFRADIQERRRSRGVFSKELMADGALTSLPTLHL